MSRILITSALPYINGIKHLGNLVGSLLPSDILARFLRARGEDVLFICATDEHGTPAELAAIDAGQSVADYCREQHEIQADIYRRFGISTDHFGRSSSKENHELTQHFCQKLDEAGLIEERVISQVYSTEDKRFLPDRYIVGVCPSCGYERARGDQCENCTRLLEPTDLLDARSTVSGSKQLEIRETRHLFLKQSVMEQQIKNWVSSHENEWPHLVTSIARKWLAEGLQDRCITRDLSWGVPVDRPGFEDKVFYVWFDAPIAYIAATREWETAAPEGEMRDWRSWWQKPNDVRYIQIMGKDNIPFHTLSFPCTLLGALSQPSESNREEWKTVDYIKGFNWLNWSTGKFSTSERRGIFTDQALAEFPADYWRYVLAANAPETSDSVFSTELFVDTVNKDLADVLGNFVNRTLKFCHNRFEGCVPEGGQEGPDEIALMSRLQELQDNCSQALADVNLRKSVAAMRALWVCGNEYLAHAAPWTAIKSDRDKAAMITRTALNLIAYYARISAPVIPEIAKSMAEQVGQTLETSANWPNLKQGLAYVEVGAQLPEARILIEKIDENRAKDLKERYNG